MALDGATLDTRLDLALGPGDGEATDPITFLAVPGLVLLAALLASRLPAQRATEADPMSILRAS